MNETTAAPRPAGESETDAMFEIREAIRDLDSRLTDLEIALDIERRPFGAE